VSPSKVCFDLIKGYEKFRPTAYLPTKDDVWTIGYGHTEGVKEGDTCTLFQAEQWLYDDLEPVCAAVNTYVTFPIVQYQFDALVSFTYNVGIYAFRESTLLRKLEDGDVEGATAEFDRWNKQKGKVLGGLVARRTEERKMFEGQRNDKIEETKSA